MRMPNRSSSTTVVMQSKKRLDIMVVDDGTGAGLDWTGLASWRRAGRDTGTPAGRLILCGPLGDAIVGIGAKALDLT